MQGLRRANALTRHLRRNADEFLRLIVAYDTRSIDVVYRRDGLSPVGPPDAVATLVARHREDRERAEWFGSHHSTVDVFDDAIVLHFGYEEGGTLVTLDPVAAADLSRFVRNCRDHLERQRQTT